MSNPRYIILIEVGTWNLRKTIPQIAAIEKFTAKCVFTTPIKDARYRHESRWLLDRIKYKVFDDLEEAQADLSRMQERIGLFAERRAAEALEVLTQERIKRVKFELERSDWTCP